MARKTMIVDLSLSEEAHKKVEGLAEQMKVSESEVLREILREYVASERRQQQIKRWGEETARILNIKNEDDVDRIIHELRQEKPDTKGDT